MSTSPAAFTAATRVVWSFEFTALETMSFVGYMGAPPTIFVPIAPMVVVAPATEAFWSIVTPWP